MCISQWFLKVYLELGVLLSGRMLASYTDLEFNCPATANEIKGYLQEKNKNELSLSNVE